MANIPVERTSSGVGWLPWLLGLLVLGALVFVGFLILDDPDNEDMVGAEDTVGAIDGEDLGDEPLAAGMGPEADVTADLAAATLLAATDPSEFIGETYTLGDLRVMEVTGDATFTVSPDGSDQMMLVYLEEEMTPGVTGVEGRYDVNAGQTVQLVGTVQRLTEQDLSEWGISPSGVSAGDLYVRASRLDLMNAELDQVEVDDNPIE